MFLSYTLNWMSKDIAEVLCEWAYPYKRTAGIRISRPLCWNRKPKPPSLFLDSSFPQQNMPLEKVEVSIQFNYSLNYFLSTISFWSVGLSSINWVSWMVFYAQAQLQFCWQDFPICQPCQYSMVWDNSKRREKLFCDFLWNGLSAPSLVVKLSRCKNYLCGEEIPTVPLSWCWLWWQSHAASLLSLFHHRVVEGSVSPYKWQELFMPGC